MTEQKLLKRGPKGDAGARSRRQILETAAELFSSQGYSATGVRQVADAVGVRTSSLYYHFSSKERLLEEIMKTSLELTSRAVYEAVANLSEEATAKEKINCAITAHLKVIHASLHYTAVGIRFEGQLPRQVVRALRPAADEYSDFWRKLLEEAQSEGSLKPNLNLSLLRSMLLGSLNRTLSWFDHTQGPIDGVINTATELFEGMWCNKEN